MKIISKLTIGLATATLLFAGCNNNTTAPTKKGVVKPTISEESLGLRKKSLYNENTNVAPRKTSYGKSAAGSGYKIKRAFQDAPPMIPHDTTGMLPIKIGNNQCIGCHAPEVASGIGATPYPASHMTNFRPHSYAISGKNTSSEKLAHISIKKENKLIGARFNCSQCHAPQSDTPLAVENKFEPQYNRKDGASRSSWNGKKLMEGINTYESSK
jgi:cytochrome c-type protein NapB